MTTRSRIRPPHTSSPPGSGSSVGSFSSSLLRENGIGSMSPCPDARRSFGIPGCSPLGILALVLLLLASGTPVRAEYFTIGSFHADIVVHRDSLLAVTETIETAFTSPPHGIFRAIPFRDTPHL